MNTSVSVNKRHELTYQPVQRFVPVFLIESNNMNLALEFTEWANAQGVKIDGVAIQEYPGRGFGLVSERSIKVCKSTI